VKADEVLFGGTFLTLEGGERGDSGDGEMGRRTGPIGAALSKTGGAGEKKVGSSSSERQRLSPSPPLPSALAIKEGRILALGDWDDVKPFIGSNTETHNLEGKTVVPGFNDAHIHVWKVGQLRTNVLDLRGVDSLERVYQLVQERAEALEPGQWLLGRGWNEAVLKEGTTPTKAGLDAAAPQNPTLLTRTCAHIHAVNSSALQSAGVTSSEQAPAGGEIDLERGLIFETAYGLIFRAIPAFTQADYEKWILAGTHYLRSLGITSATDPAVDPPLYAAYRALEARGLLPIRMNLLYIRRPDGGDTTYPLPEKCSSAFLRCDSVKFFADGGLSGATAAVSQPYRNTEFASKGVLRFDTEELHKLMLEAHTAGFRIGTHAIGDVALEQVIGVYERLYREHPSSNGPNGTPRSVKHRLEHFGLPSEDHLERVAKLCLFAVPQPIFWQELGDNFRRYLPDEFLERCYNLRAMLEHGISVAFSSDGPVVKEVSPLAGIQAACTVGPGPVSVMDALEAYTLGGARAQGDEGNRGTLTVGKWADLTVLDRNPLEVPLEELSSLRVLQTFVGGRVSVGENPALEVR